jgi:four helix bundle protein
MAHNPNRLHVVKRAEVLVTDIHAFARRHRRRLGELSPGLRNQLLRSCVSISLNLVEACGYHSAGKAAALLDVSIGSCNEVERVLSLCRLLGLEDERTAVILHEVGVVRAMLYGFRRRIMTAERDAQK